MRIYSRRGVKPSNSNTQRNERRRQTYAAKAVAKAVSAKAHSHGDDADVDFEAPANMAPNPADGSDAGASGHGDAYVYTDRSEDPTDRSGTDSGTPRENTQAPDPNRSGFGHPAINTVHGDRSASAVPDQSENDNWSSLSPKTKNACLLANWQATRGKASDNAMADLLENVIPQLDTSRLPTWRQVPGLIFAADGYRKPEWREFVVCKTCGVTKDDTLQPSHCPWCTTRVTTADEWVSQGCTIMHLADIVASWFRNPDDVAALLSYLREPEVKSSMAHSPRARHYYDLLDQHGQIAQVSDLHVSMHVTCISECKCVRPV
jgi:hypothetical protein